MTRVVDEPLQRVLGIHRRIDVSLPAGEMLGQVASMLAAEFSVPVAIAAHRGTGWEVLAASADADALPLTNERGWTDLDQTAEPIDAGIGIWREEGREPWTLVRLATLPAVLMIQGDWTHSIPLLKRLSTDLVPVPGQPSGNRSDAAACLAVAGHRLSRALSRVSGEGLVCATVLSHLVRVVPSRVGAFAVPDGDGSLRIVATHGYPMGLVGHLRISPGTGVLGGVHQRRAPLRVADVREHPDVRHRRLRYRTHSFIAVPVLATGDALGVVALTDRADGQAFSRADVSSVRALLAPAALALSRERQRRQSERYALSAAIDPVSGLYNRRYFESRLEEEVQRGRREGLPVALLMLDIDDFKGINDRFGHLAGDRVISDVSEILRRSVRAFDVCARYGGEEFAVLMPSNGPEGAAATAERIRGRIEAYRPAPPELSTLRVTASVGIASSRDAESRTLIDQADRALYVAKRSGKNQVRIEPGVPPVERRLS